LEWPHWTGQGFDRFGRATVNVATLLKPQCCCKGSICAQLGSSFESMVDLPGAKTIGCGDNDVQELARIRQRFAENAENQCEGEPYPNAGPSVGGSQPQQTLGQEIAAFDKPEVDGQQTEEMQNMTAFQEEQTQVQEVAERDQPPDEKEQIDDPHDTELL
jgi:hypothetical protein